MLFLKRHETLKNAIELLPEKDVSQQFARENNNIVKSKIIIHDHLYHERKKLEPSLMQIKEDIEGYVKKLEKGIEAIGNGFINDGRKDIEQAIEQLDEIEKNMKKFSKFKKDAK